MTRPRPLEAARGLFLSFAIAASACSGPPGDQIFVPTVPTTEGFPAVSEALEVHCGTLDCHGASVRNLRIYGINGLRLNRGLTPGSEKTSPEEQKATYEALIAIQPEVLTTIVRSGGAGPERWIVITKGRGSEHHKGGSRMKAHDDTDTCITSWLTGVVNADACGRAIELQHPESPGF